MKRIVCLALTFSILLSGFSPKFCYAGGREGTDTLPNGTTIRYVPQYRIHNVIQEYQDLVQQNLNRNFTLEQDVAIKCGAVLFGVFSWWTGNLIRNGGSVPQQPETSVTQDLIPQDPSCTRKVLSSLCTGGGILASIGAFFYPNWVAYDVDKKNGTHESFVAWCLSDGINKTFGYTQVLDQLQWHQIPPSQHACQRDIPDDDGIAIVTRSDGRTAVKYQSTIDKLRQVENFPYGFEEYPDGWNELHSNRFGTNDTY